MMYWLLYDIVNDRRRAKAVRLCRDCGLERLQKSCFFGELQKGQLTELKEKMRNLIADEDSLYLIPIASDMVGQICGMGSAGRLAETVQPEVCFF